MQAQPGHFSGTPDLVSGIMLLILAASLTAMLGGRFARLPFTIALVLVGALIAALAPVLPPLAMLASFQLTPELVLFVFLPTLIFESAHNLPVRRLLANLAPVLTLAVPGLLLSTGIIGGVFYLFGVFDLITCLLLGAILSATDPVAVIALFRQLGVPERLTVLVEGESLFNDATSLVVATLLTGILISGVFGPMTVVTGAGDFLRVFAGGCLVGALLAFGVCQLLGRIDTQPPVEISLTTVLAYGAFIIAEHNLHVSGIMAVVAAGLVMGSYGRSKVSPGTEHYMHQFWDYAAWLANALIFLMVGMRMEPAYFGEYGPQIVLVAVAMLLSRAVVVFGLVPQLARLKDSEPVSRGYQLVMYWGGLRGAIAIAIVLSLPEFPAREALVVIVMGAVLFTLLVQGLTVEPLVRRLGLHLPEFAERVAEAEAELHAKQASLAGIDRLEHGEFFSARVAKTLREDAEADIARLEQDIDALVAEMSDDNARTILAVRALSREKTRYDELFRRGLIGDWAWRELGFNVNVQLEDARHYGRLPGRRFEHPPTYFILLRLTRLLAGLPLVGGWLEGRQHLLIMRDYEVSWARYRAVVSVLKNLDQMAEENGVSGEPVEGLRAVYQKLSEATREELEQVAATYPEFVEASQRRLGRRLMLIGEQEAVDAVSKLGIVPEGVSEAVRAHNRASLRALHRTDLSAYLEVTPVELLNKVPMFECLTPEQFGQLIPCLQKRSFPRDQCVIEQGSRGDSLFMIARGVVSVEEQREGESRELACLYPGDCFGEAALLHGTTRNASVTAKTPCSLYELRREDWLALCERHPSLDEAIQSIDRQRSLES